MALTLLTGRANVGKTARVAAAIRASVDHCGRATLLLPSYPDALRARAHYAAQGPRVGLEVTTPNRYFAALWASRGDGRRVVNAVQRAALVARAVAETPLRATAASAEHRGFVRSVEHLASAMTGPLRDRVVGDAPAELARVLVAYRRMLDAEGLIEPEETVRILADSYRPEWTTGILALNDFHDLTFAQEAYLTAAARGGSEVLLSLTWEEGFPATRMLDPLVARLPATPLHIEPDRTATDVPAELAAIADAAFRDPGTSPGAPVTGAVRLSEGGGDEAEDDRIAAEILLAAEAGIEAGSIAVGFRDSWSRAGGVVRALGEAGVPAIADVRVPVSETGLGRAVMHLARSHGECARARDVAAFLRSPYSGADTATVALLEGDWRRSRVSDGRRALMEAAARLDPAAARTLSLGAALAGGPCDAARWQDVAVRMLVNAYGREAPGMDVHGRIDAAVCKAMIDAAEAAAALGEDVPADQVMLALEESEVGAGDLGASAAGAGGPGRVLVTSAERLRGRRFEMVVIGGLDTRGFMPSSGNDAFGTPEMKDALAEAGLILDRADSVEADRNLLYSVCTRATKRLVLSRRTCDSDGRELGPAPLLDEFLDVYRTTGAKAVEPPLIRTALDAGRFGASDGDAPNTRKRALRSCSAAGGASVAEGSPRAVVEARRRSAPRNTGILDERVAARLAERKVFSASEIEAYLRCPYRWFHERAIGARSLDSELGPMEMGAIVHDALGEFYARLPAKTGAARLTPDTAEGARPLAESCLEAAISRAPAAVCLAEEEGVAKAQRAVLGFLAEDASFLPEFAPAGPEWLEHTFGDRGAGEEMGGFELHGRIDRVDVDAAGRLAVYDYKTSVRPDHGWERAHAHGVIQVALYCEVVRRRLGGQVVAGLYRAVGPRNVIGKQNRGFYHESLGGGAGLAAADALDREGLDSQIVAAVEAARRVVEGIRAGAIPATPLDPGGCPACRYSGMCGGPR